MSTQNLKFKVKEFEWFQMETRVRQIIQEVLGPMQKRTLQNSNVLHKLKINQAQDENRLNQITLMIANDPKVFETGVFLAVEHKFEEQHKHIEELSRQINESSKYVDEKFKILDIRMEESSEVLKNVASLRERISKEIELQNDNINKLRINIEAMINSLGKDIREARTVQQLNLEACEKQDFLLGEENRALKNSIRELQAVIDSHREQHRQENAKLAVHSEQLQRHRESIEDLQESKALTKKLHEFVKHMDNELTRAQFKIDNIAPLITQAQISDCLYAVLPPKMRKRISVHQYKKYFQFNREVLEKSYTEIKDKFQGLQLLEKMQKNNTKEIVQLKRKKLMSMGIDVDHLTYEQRQKHYSELTLDDALDDDDDEVKVTNKVDERQVLTVVESFFRSFTESVSQKVQTELSDSKKYLYDLEEELRFQLTSYESRFMGVKKECETFHTEKLLEEKSKEEDLRGLQREIDALKSECSYSRDMQRLFYNFCSLVNHLQIQDEIDKQNISLMGVQENSAQTAQVRQKQNPLDLDKKCFSCCGYPAATLSAFKMACLTYNPSPIKIDNREYKRQELLEFTTSMLHNIKKNIQTPPEEITQTDPLARTKFKNSVLEMHLQQSTISHARRDHEEDHETQPKVRLETEEAEGEKKSSHNRFRKTRKFLSIPGGTTSTQKTNLDKSHSKTGSQVRGDMLNLSAAFNQLRRKNKSFLK